MDARLSAKLHLLGQRVEPFLLQGIAGSGIECRVVAGRTNGNSGDKVSIDSRVELGPGVLSGPASIARQAKTLCAGCTDGAADEGGSEELCGSSGKLHGGKRVEVEGASGELAEVSVRLLYR
jgi:hypothetical protein